MVEDEEGSLISGDNANSAFSALLKRSGVDKSGVELLVVENIDSTNMKPDCWEKVGQIIAEEYDNHDSFLITTGTNTLAYLASALSFSLENIDKPVVITGSQISFGKSNADAVSNFVNALSVCRFAKATGVLVVFGSKIIRGCRSKKATDSELDAFSSFNEADVGNIGVDSGFYRDCVQHDPRKPFRLVNGFDPNICCLTLIPGLSETLFESLIYAGTKGFILRAYGTGDVSDYLFGSLEKCKNRQIPVVVTTQCPRGSTSIGKNRVGEDSKKFNVVEAVDMSMESMSTKLMWLIAQKYSYQEICNLMSKDFRGEISQKFVYTF